MNSQQACSHTDPRHAYRSVEACRAISALKRVVGQAAWDEEFGFLNEFLVDEPSEPRRHVADRQACQSAFDYIPRLGDLSGQRAHTLEKVSEFARMPSHSGTDESQGHSEARKQLVDRMRLCLQRLADHAPQDVPVLQAHEPQVGVEECKAVVTHIQRQEERLVLSDQVLEVVTDFISDRRALQKEQYAVSAPGTPQAEKAKRVLQGKLDARKELAALIRTAFHEGKRGRWKPV
ncbi:hypothetical protein LG284_05445 [Citricoccus nitrophenolicus]